MSTAASLPTPDGHLIRHFRSGATGGVTYPSAPSHEKIRQVKMCSLEEKNDVMSKDFRQITKVLDMHAKYQNKQLRWH